MDWNALQDLFCSFSPLKIEAWIRRILLDGYDVLVVKIAWIRRILLDGYDVLVVKMFTRMTKIEFPKFGGDYVRGWLYKCKNFFVIDSVSDPHKAQLTSIHLFDIASIWHRQFIKAIDENNVRHVGTIEEYQNAFDKLISRVDLLVDQHISFYIVGLQTDVELAVKMFRPRTLAEVY
nr:hypothetical protein [Tanacetum cinerariifolium]